MRVGMSGVIDIETEEDTFYITQNFSNEFVVKRLNKLKQVYEVVYTTSSLSDALLDVKIMSDSTQAP